MIFIDCIKEIYNLIAIASINVFMLKLSQINNQLTY